MKLCELETGDYFKIWLGLPSHRVFAFILFHMLNIAGHEKQMNDENRIIQSD